LRTSRCALPWDRVVRMRNRYRTYGKRRSLRLPRYAYRGERPCHLIIGTRQGAPFLREEGLVVELVGLIRSMAAENDVRVYAFCVMPDHVHLVAAAVGDVDLVQFVQRFKSLSTRIYWQHGGRGKLWQRGFYDHVVREEEDLRAMVRYVLENPLRKGLAERVGDYPGNGSTEFDLRDLY